MEEESELYFRISQSELNQFRQEVNESPYARSLGISINELLPGESYCRLVTSHNSQLLGQKVAAGGISALVEVATASAVIPLFPLPSSLSIIETKINFLRAAKVDEIYGVGKLIDRGKNLCLVEVAVTDRHGNLLAKASSNLMAG